MFAPFRFPVLLAIAAATLALAGDARTAYGAIVYGTEIPGAPLITGSRTGAVGGGVNAGSPEWGAGFTIEWEITDNGDGTWHYKYTFTDTDGALKIDNISHFTLDISNDLEISDILDPELNGSNIAAGNLEIGDLDGITGAIKFDIGPGDGPTSVVYEFDVARVAVWGNFFVKDGAAGPAHNVGLGNEGTSENTNDFIGVPDTREPEPGPLVPEPTSLAAWLLGAGGLGLILRRRMNKSA